MSRFLIAILAVASSGACGRSQGVDDKDLGGLVIAAKTKAEPIDIAKAAKDPAELGRALAVPEGALATALGPHVVAISSSTVTTEGTAQVEQLDDKTTIELGDAGAFHAVYTNSADYGREATFTGGKLYLRPRYQKWHGRAPEAPDEPAQLRDSFYEPIFATWDLLAPGAELTDAGTEQVAGRAGHKITVRLSPNKQQPPAEPLAQKKWREHRSVDALEGTVVLDADKGVPLSVKLAGTVSFTRDGRRFSLKITVDSAVQSLGATAIAAPADGEVVATPERLREVDDRDLLLQGIAPPTRKAQPEGAAGAKK